MTHGNFKAVFRKKFRGSEMGWDEMGWLEEGCTVIGCRKGLSVSSACL